MGAYDAMSYGSHLFFSMIRVGFRLQNIVVTCREIISLHIELLRLQWCVGKHLLPNRSEWLSIMSRMVNHYCQQGTPIFLPSPRMCYDVMAKSIHTASCHGGMSANNSTKTKQHRYFRPTRKHLCR